MEAVDVHGRFVWHHLLTKDVPGAKKFYPSITGWKAQTWPADPDYTICVAADVPAASMMAFTPDMPAEAPSHWLPYIGTRDVDGTAAAAVRAGGSIVKEPTDLKGAGRYAVLKDPQGAQFAIIDPENARGEPKGVPPLGHFSWHELATSDNEAAFAFYNGLFGWDAITRMDMGSMGVYLIFGQDGEQKGGIYIKPPDMPSSPGWLPYVHVPNVDALTAVVASSGGKVLFGPMEVPGGSRVAAVQDPGGAAFALHSYPPAAGAAASAGEAAPKSKAKTRPKVKARPKTKMKMKKPASPKAKTKAKAKPKTKARAKAARPARKSPRGKSKSMGGMRAKSKARPNKHTARRKK